MALETIPEEFGPRDRETAIRGRSGDIVTPLAASVSTHAPSEPSRGQLAPPSASTSPRIDGMLAIRRLKQEMTIIYSSRSSDAATSAARPSQRAAATTPAAAAMP